MNGVVQIAASEHAHAHALLSLVRGGSDDDQSSQASDQVVQRAPFSPQLAGRVPTSPHLERRVSAPALMMGVRGKASPPALTVRVPLDVKAERADVVESPLITLSRTAAVAAASPALAPRSPASVLAASQRHTGSSVPGTPVASVRRPSPRSRATRKPSTKPLAPSPSAAAAPASPDASPSSETAALTPLERRKMKNRCTAQAFRQRHRAYVASLEAKVRDAPQEIAAMRSMTNRVMREHAADMQRLVQALQVFPSGAGLSASEQQWLQDLQESVASGKRLPLPPRDAAAIPACKTEREMVEAVADAAVSARRSGAPSSS